MDYYSQRLIREIQLLRCCELMFKLPAAPIVGQLIADVDRPLPDRLPQPPAWTTFEWPCSGEVDFRTYWREVDKHSKWTGEYL